MEKRQYKTFGIAVSQYGEWEGRTICGVFLDPLEDSTFPYLAAGLVKIIDARLGASKEDV